LSSGSTSQPEEPEEEGKPLVAELAGYRVGIRKEGNSTDIYNLARKLIRLRLFNPGE